MHNGEILSRHRQHRPGLAQAVVWRRQFACTGSKEIRQQTLSRSDEREGGAGGERRTRRARGRKDGNQHALGRRPSVRNCIGRRCENRSRRRNARDIIKRLCFARSTSLKRSSRNGQRRIIITDNRATNPSRKRTRTTTTKPPTLHIRRPLTNG